MDERVGGGLRGADSVPQTMGLHLPVETTRGRACGGREMVPKLRAAARSTASHPCPPLRLQALLRNRRTTLQELSSHEVFLTKLNLELIKDIQDMEDSSALKVRTMLQEQDILQVRSHPHLPQPWPPPPAPRSCPRHRPLEPSGALSWLLQALCTSCFLPLEDESLPLFAPPSWALELYQDGGSHSKASIY